MVIYAIRHNKNVQRPLQLCVDVIAYALFCR